METREIKKARFTRNGKTVEMELLKITHPCGYFGWITKANGKPFYGTRGYFNEERYPAEIKTYRNKTIVENLEWI